MAMRRVYKIDELLLYIYMISVMIFPEGNIVKVGLKFLFLLGSLFLACIRPYIGKGFKYIYVWMLFFSLVCVFSVRYAINVNTASAMVSTIVLNFICLFFIYHQISYSPSLLLCVAKGMVLLPIALSIITYAKGGLLIFMNGRGIGSWMNANTVAIELAFGLFVVFYLLTEFKWALSSGTKTLLKLYVPISIIFIVLTASRKGLLVMILPIIIYKVLSSKNSLQIMKYMFLGVLVTFIAYEMIMNITPLYNIIGYRIEGMLNYFLNSGATDTSTATRMMMIESGKQWFSQRPWLGYGIDNYRELIYLHTYAHNNYIELAVDVGLIGTFSYYSIYIYIVFSYFSSSFLKKEYSSICCIAVSAIITILFVDYGMVSYFDKYITFLICVLATIISNKERIKSSIEEVGTV